MTILNVPDSPKTLRETLCIAQAAIHRGFDRKHWERLQRLIDECDRHTPTCGCEDKPVTGRLVL